MTAILRQRLGDRLQTGQALRQQHAHTTTWLPTQAPDGVVFVRSSEEVAEVVKICAEHSVPIIPFGTGSSLEGHVNAPAGGISVDLSQMNAVLEVHGEDLDCRVQAGVTRKQLNEYLRDTGLFFPIDPGADASLGGMAATRASGTNAVRYGTMKDVVLGLTAVMADGEIIHTGGRAKKSSAGYDLTRLLVGSEGTLGIITELRLRLFGIPEAIGGGVCAFPDLESACNTVIMTIQCGLPIARIELLDTLQVKACNAYSKLDLQESPTLFVEFHGSELSVNEQLELFGAIAADNGGGDFTFATKPEDRNRLWTARHDAYWAALGLRPGAKAFPQTSACRFPGLRNVSEAARDIEEMGLIAPIVGHVGDGNFHVTPLVDLSNPEEIANTETFLSWLAELAISMDGTCTGEHGIGQGKRVYLRKELGEAVDVMVSIKAALDPLGIMNPGKIL